MQSLIVLAMAAAAPAASEAPAAANPAQPLVCRSIQRIGSRLGTRRSCKPQAEWDALEAATRNGVRDAQQRQVAPTVDLVAGQPNGMMRPNGPN